MGSAADEGMSPELMEVAGRLTQTQDAFDPALQAEKSRRRLSSVAVSSVKLNFILGFGLILSIGANAFLSYRLSVEQIQYFASTPDGRFLPIVPVSEPYKTAAEVIQFAKDTVSSSFALDFLNWRSQLESSRGLYTNEGFKSFLNALDQSGMLESVRSKRMNMTVTGGTGILAAEGRSGGVYVWLVEMPIEIRFAGQTTELAPQQFKATLRVERAPTYVATAAVLVAQIVTTPR